MTAAESDAIDAVLKARGWRVVGNVSSDPDGGTPEELDLLFGDRQPWAARELRRLNAEPVEVMSA